MDFSLPEEIQILRETVRRFVDKELIPLEREYRQVLLESLNPSWMVLGDGFRQSVIGSIAKRAFDVRVSSVLLIVCLPVLLIGGAPEEATTGEDLRALVEKLLAEGYSPSQAAKEAARRTGAKKSEAYRFAVEAGE